MNGYMKATSHSLFTFMHWRKKWQPTPVFLPRESQGRREPGGLPSMESHRVGHDWRDLAAVAAATYTSTYDLLDFTPGIGGWHINKSLKCSALSERIAYCAVKTVAVLNPGGDSIENLILWSNFILFIFF